MSQDLEIEEHICPFCEKSQDDCACQHEGCPACGGEMDPLDASECAGCESYYPECTCKQDNREVSEK